MSNNVPAPVNQADEHAVETRTFGWGHNRLAHLARRIQSGYDRCVKGSQDWVEGSLEVAAALREGRDAVPADIAFSVWLKTNHLDFYTAHERRALIHLASDLALFRTILGETDSRSYELIWRKNKARFASARKPTRPGRPRKPRMIGVADIHRRTKLGDKTVEKIKATSLASAREQDALVFLNRGAPDGELRPEVKQLVTDAIAGKKVSAIAVRKNGVPPPYADVGSNSASEVTRLQARVDELQNENRALRAEVKKLKAERRFFF